MKVKFIYTKTDDSMKEELRNERYRIIKEIAMEILERRQPK